MHHFLRDVEKTTPTSPAPQPPESTAACANPAGGYEGFGRNTTGGAGKPVYRVTNLNDSGAGSLRDALCIGQSLHRVWCRRHDKSQSTLVTRGGNITIDGFTAPAPGNTSNVVVDHVSISGFGDGAIDVITARDVTIQWSIFGPGNPSHNFALLVKYDAFRVTLHHNLLTNTLDRNPMCGASDTATANPPELICDVRNNLVWNYGQWAVTVRQYGTANVVNNYYYSSTRTTNPGDALLLRESSLAYIRS